MESCECKYQHLFGAQETCPAWPASSLRNECDVWEQPNFMCMFDTASDMGSLRPLPLYTFVRPRATPLWVG